MYNPSVLVGGRGWLLALLLRKKPFYHAALALSACHRRTIILAQTDQIATLVQQEQHLETCLEVLSLAAQHNCGDNGLGIMATVIQLSFLEVCFALRILLFPANSSVPAHYWQRHCMADASTRGD